jgi:DNA-binding transcriptional MocR family regulator
VNSEQDQEESRRHIALIMASSDPINLIKGWPSTSLLPTKHLSRAAQTALADPSIAFPGLLYGPDEGYAPLRESLGVWLSEFYQPEQPVSKERITITGGASQNLACLLEVFTDPVYTRDIMFAAPAYMLAFRIFEDNGFSGKMKAIPEDDDGMDMGLLRKALEESEKRSSDNKTPVSYSFLSQLRPLLTSVDVQAYKTLREILPSCHLLRAHLLKSFIKDLATGSKD